MMIHEICCGSIRCTSVGINFSSVLCLYIFFQCNLVSGENGANPELEKEARRCATKVAKETKLIRDYYRQLTALQNKSSDRVS